MFRPMPDDPKDTKQPPPKSDSAPQTDEFDFGDLNEADFGDLNAPGDETDFGDLDPGSDGSEEGFEDWGDMNENGGAEMTQRMERELKEHRESIEADRERNRRMAKIESHIQETLMVAAVEQAAGDGSERGKERLKRIEDRSRKLQELRHGKVAGFVQESGSDDRVAAEVVAKIAEAGAASKTEVAALKMEGRTSYAIYKSRDGRYAEHMRDDPHDQEGRVPKEWLGSQLDFILNVDRSPAAVTREVSDSPEEVGGAMVEMVSAQSGQETLWENSLSDDEISRVADFHYLVWESDGHNSQYLVENDSRLITIDRGESFMEGQQPLRSEAVMATRERRLGANPEVLTAAEQYLKDKRLRSAVQEAFQATFGENEGLKRYIQFQSRVEKYVVAKGIPAEVTVERTPNAEEIRRERLKKLNR